MDGWTKKNPGWRPFGFWICDVSNSDLARADRASCDCETAVILHLGLADEAERKAIKRGRLLEKDRAAWRRDTELHGDD
jgi:hypothetical protein